MANIAKVIDPKPTGKPGTIRLELVIEYEAVSDVMDETNDLIERARQGGFVLRATLFNLPPTIAIV